MAYGVTPSGRFFLDHLLTKDLYVGTFGSLVKYSKERVNATLAEVSSSSSQIVLSLTDTLDDVIYDRPLTVRSELPRRLALRERAAGQRRGHRDRFDPRRNDAGDLL